MLPTRLATRPTPAAKIIIFAPMPLASPKLTCDFAKPAHATNAAITNASSDRIDCQRASRPATASPPSTATNADAPRMIHGWTSSWRPSHSDIERPSTLMYGRNTPTMASAAQASRTNLMGFTLFPWLKCDGPLQQSRDHAHTSRDQAHREQ